MSRYYYDLHIHSCLSPCADDDNTPNNLLGMAQIAGINILALTDHNTTKNCPAFFEAACRYGIIPVAGMELTTSEDIHVVCLFERLEDAMLFNSKLDEYRVPFPNRPDIFGRQLITDKDDNVIAEEKNLLSNATQISLEELPELIESYGGVCYPAHIDRDANGIIATLGTFPITPVFECVEFHSEEKIPEYNERYAIEGKLKLVSSDAHYLTDIRDAQSYLELSAENDSAELVRGELFRMLRCKNGGIE